MTTAREEEEEEHCFQEECCKHKEEQSKQCEQCQMLMNENDLCSLELMEKEEEERQTW